MTNDVYTSFLMGWRQPPLRCAVSSPVALFWSEPKRSVSGPRKRVQLTFRLYVFVKALNPPNDLHLLNQYAINRAVCQGVYYITTKNIYN